jgi:hypothetical protein
MSEAMQRHIFPMPAWLVFSGATIGIVGASVTKHAESVDELIVAVDGRADPSNLAAVAPGEWGLGLLIVGAVVALSGLVVAARRPNLNIFCSKLSAGGRSGSEHERGIGAGNTKPLANLAVRRLIMFARVLHGRPRRKRRRRWLGSH